VNGCGVEGDLQRLLGRRLRAYRQERELSQEAFADLVGVHRTYMGGIERGERNLTLKSVERIAERLGVDPLDLLRPDQSDAGEPAGAAGSADAMGATNGADG
jgi:transcriptional regulator with XRE-family HTH domain